MCMWSVGLVVVANIDDNLRLAVRSDGVAELHSITVLPLLELVCSRNKLYQCLLFVFID
jgi:hypothetical protein